MSGEMEINAENLMYLIGQSVRYHFKRDGFDFFTPDEWRWFLRWYRDLRIRVPHAAPGHERCGHGEPCMRQGMYYGMSRDDAREFLWKFTTELDWHRYLGTK